MDNDQQQQPAREPMTAARLAAIRERAEVRPLLDFGGVDQPGNGPGARQRVQACFADRWQLLAFAEAALPILRAVANDNGFQRSECFLCGALTLGWTNGMVHTDDCPVTQARALLAGMAGGTDESEGQS